MAIVRRCTFPGDPHIITSGNHRMCPLHGFEIEEIEVPDDESDEDATSSGTDGHIARDDSAGGAPSGFISTTTMQDEGPQFSVEFPWGEEPIQGILRVGRDPSFSPLAGKMDSDRSPVFATVSGVHAEFRQRDGRLFIVHLHATNPTYVDGWEIESGIETEVHNDSEVGFSNRVKCRVRMRD